MKLIIIIIGAMKKACNARSVSLGVKSGSTNGENFEKNSLLNIPSHIAYFPTAGTTFYY